MGYYVAPISEAKEAWLERHSVKKADVPPEWSDIPEGCLVVCLVDNKVFTAAGIAYDEEELARFKEPDKRKRVWYMIPKTKLIEVNPSLKEVLR